MTEEQPVLKDVLFPHGPPTERDATVQPLLDQYRLMVETPERVVARRQTANTFFLSINSALLIATGILLREGGVLSPVGAGVGVGIGLMGLSICFVWWRMITSFRQLNTAKFKIIDLLEQNLPAVVFGAEWVALGRGKNPSLYRPFTHLEKQIPVGLMCLYGLASGAGIIVGITSAVR